MEYIFEKDRLDDLLEKLEDEDTVIISGGELLSLLGKTRGLPRGRKPIEVDLALFDETVSLWQSGRITAKQAMEKLELKPNTFYRRIKERGKAEMKDMRSEIKETIKEEKKELGELKKQIREDARSIKVKANEKIENRVSMHQMEIDIQREKLAAEIDHLHTERELRAAVEKERETHKESTNG